METIVMAGKPVAEEAKSRITAKIELAKAQGRKITLAIVVVGDDAASHVYKKRLVKITESLGAEAMVYELAANVQQAEVEKLIEKLNDEDEITGILPMMPLPRHLNSDAIGTAITPSKDVDCLNPLNAGEVYLARSKWAPCTPRACMAILNYYGIEVEGKNVVVLGRSNVVGKPVALLLVQENATVTICHSRTKNLPEILKQADIIVAAVGIPSFVKPEMVKEGVVIVDVGINAVDGKFVGDVDAAVSAKAAAFTPVPGGVGVVSNMMVMDMLSRCL
ncbi:MAG TPA: bifunctional 5,10-methylenetetrahydrofolate dehydrogenase/5,10-methenyltetrahydrofolate cyclohydrolase [Candidatus Avacidaminococcus intestinavium]|uniref:Bifunctional protein FolD n=1 Tax=Candidatus Avacidaminococcus intestinavium TaxID=2840684 RepID=A0A9D1MQ48_9FIRM|nr:bifunctional 5,10-methylenetetrahydrofolate dehydrogenase/5,10-methenyltetrahydrofolate cyclohydrolase [Candidatus Avacidaminococcus intestinavium]